MRTVRAKFSFSFRSFGVTIRITSNRLVLFERAVETARRSLIDRIEPVEVNDPDHIFHFGWDDERGYYFEQNHKYVTGGRFSRGIYKYFDSILRIAVAEYSPNLVFLHAGAVGWKGKAIIIPGDSYTGKSTLVTELVKHGAIYFSDEFAIIDRDGLLQPFARPINLRARETFDPVTVDPASIGEIAGKDRLPIGTIFITEYNERSAWRPRILTPAKGALKVLPHAIPLRRSPEFTLGVLNTICRNALIVDTKRNNAKEIAQKLLHFVDNPVI